MNPIDIASLHLPAAILEPLKGEPLFRHGDGWSGAGVFFSPAQGGLYLKTDEPGKLKNAALMQDFFHKHGLSSALVAYETQGADYLLTRRVNGENGISARHISDPQRLAAALGEAARRLHETPADGCPVRDFSAQLEAQVASLLEGAARLTPHIADYLRVFTPESALREIEEMAYPVAGDTLLHGDLCLPNFMLDDFRFTGFIDLGEGGVGDRHYDLFWTAWSLSHNLGGDRFRDTFLDAYGRDAVDEAKMRFFGLINCLEPA